MSRRITPMPVAIKLSRTRQCSQRLNGVLIEKRQISEDIESAVLDSEDSGYCPFKQPMAAKHAGLRRIAEKDVKDHLAAPLLSLWPFAGESLHFCSTVHLRAKEQLHIVEVWVPPRASRLRPEFRLQYFGLRRIGAEAALQLIKSEYRPPGTLFCYLARVIF